jgi:vacuolar iron transporter family protein
MKQTKIPESIIPVLLRVQKNEITEHHIYTKLAESVKDEHNKKILQKIAGDEKSHYELWKKFTERDVNPGRWRIFKFYWISRILGLTFGI